MSKYYQKNYGSQLNYLHLKPDLPAVPMVGLCSQQPHISADSTVAIIAPNTPAMYKAHFEEAISLSTATTLPTEVEACCGVLWLGTSHAWSLGSPHAVFQRKRRGENDGDVYCYIYLNSRFIRAPPKRDLRATQLLKPWKS